MTMLCNMYYNVVIDNNTQIIMGSEEYEQKDEKDV